MIIQFVDRESDLEFLNNKFKEKGAEFIPIYGRRRVGKTELILEFIKEKPAVYFLASLIEDKENLKKVSELLGDFFNDTALKLNQFRDWDNVFVYLSEKAKTKRFIFIIDEFPYLARIRKGISSIFQAGWDQHLKNTNTFLILCGSSIGMMYKEVLAYKAPLYGRRTGQIELKPMPFKNIGEFFPQYTFENKIKAYALLGGMPAYLKTFDDKLSISKNLEKMLNKNHPLFNEPEILVKEELREPSKYMTILKAIAFGKTKINEISNYTEIERTTLFKYLSVLEELAFIEKQLPATEKNPHKSKKGLYFLKDEFFSFWLKFILPFKSEIEKGEAIQVIKKIEDGLNQHIGYAFENICRQLIWDLKPMPFNKAGRWWGHTQVLSPESGILERKEIEIDIVCLNEEKKGAIFIECKWSDVKEGEARKLLGELKEKSKFVEWKREKERFGLIAKKIFGKDNLRKEGFFAWDLEDLEKIMKRS